MSRHPVELLELGIIGFRVLVDDVPARHVAATSARNQHLAAAEQNGDVRHARHRHLASEVPGARAWIIDLGGIQGVDSIVTSSGYQYSAVAQEGRGVTLARRLHG